MHALAMSSLQCYESYEFFKGWTIDMTNGEKCVNPLLDGTSLAKWEPEKKDPLRGSFFSYRPPAGAAPRSVPTQQTVYVVAPTLQLLTIP